MDSMWKEVTARVNEHGYMSGVDRQSERVKKTAEVFTPTDTVIDIIQDILRSAPDALAPGKTVLDPSCGDGQFLVAAKWVKVLHYGMTEAEALNDIYGIDIMRDNVDLCKRRLGGGNIIMGNTLDPDTRLDEQTDEEHKLVIEWFGEPKQATLEDFFG
jgi:SAM-dependent methyltransferase